MRTLVTALFTLALMAAACGSGSSSTAVSTGDDGPQSFEDLDFNSPLGEFLGFDFTAQDDMEEQFAEMEREAGRIAQKCMADLGFEYTPPVQDNTVSFGPGGSDLPYFSDAWVEKYGFGITTQRFPQSMIGDLVGFDDEGFDGPDADFVDPNEDYVNGLSEGERDAYFEALYGESPDFGPEGPDEDFVFEPTGCQNVAFEQAFSDGPGGNLDGFFEAFGDELQAMEERAMAHPTVVEFNDRVGSCVSDAGLVWTSEQDLYERWEPQLNSLQPGGFGGGDPFEEAGLDPETMTDREIDDFFRELNRLDDDQLATLAALQTEELELAKVVVGCGGGSLNEQVVLGEVRVQFEQEFLDQNAAALEQFKAE